MSGELFIREYIVKYFVIVRETYLIVNLIPIKLKFIDYINVHHTSKQKNRFNEKFLMVIDIYWCSLNYSISINHDLIIASLVHVMKKLDRKKQSSEHLRYDEKTI